MLEQRYSRCMSCSLFQFRVAGLTAFANFVLQLTQNDHSETIKASALATNMKRSAGSINKIPALCH